VRKALLDLHNLEIMAVNVYRCQISDKYPDLKKALIGAMRNEMYHVQNYQIKLYEYGLKPVWYRWAFWLVGWTIGNYSKIRGRKTVLQAGVWTETRAVTHYGELLKHALWDEETYERIKSDMGDEAEHLEHWEVLLERLK
jgi:demethoxyubiquinone hydroxylase (CLK1/Coq7/Cat5 family)